MAVYGQGNAAGTVDTTRVIGWVIGYEDATRVRGQNGAEWALAPADRVQVVHFFLEDEYDSNDADGNPAPRLHFRKEFAVEEHYWFVSGLLYGAGAVADVPLGLPAGALKNGSLMASNADFRAIYNAAYADRVF